MTAIATAFQQMARVLTHRQQLREKVAGAREGTRTAALLDLLDRNGPMTSRDLADATGLTVRRVRNLLTKPRERAQVWFLTDVRLWELNRDYDDTGVKLRRAAELLRAAGWTVLPPSDTQSLNA